VNDDIVQRLRNWDDGRVSTHYEGCWDSHPVCAILLAADAIETRDAEVMRLRAEVERLMEGMELAWGLLANGQYWDRTDGRSYGDWNTARAEWRDEYWHPALDRNPKEARRGNR
jgi:hypothetical protein